MPSLPLSVSLALHATAALTSSGDRSTTLRTAWHNAHPAALEVDVEARWLKEWADDGESILFIAMPQPGRIGGLPRGLHPDILPPLLEAGECVLGGTHGGIAVPTTTIFGPPGDQGHLVEWTAYPGPAVPRHVVEATDLAHISRELIARTTAAARALEDVGGTPWRPMDTLPADPRTRPNALPRKTPAAVLLVLDRAVRIAEVARAGLAVERANAALDATTSLKRTIILTDVLDVALTALTGATNVGAMAIAGWRPA